MCAYTTTGVDDWLNLAGLISRPFPSPVFDCLRYVPPLFCITASNQKLEIKKVLASGARKRPSSGGERPRDKAREQLASGAGERPRDEAREQLASGAGERPRDEAREQLASGAGERPRDEAREQQVHSLYVTAADIQLSGYKVPNLFQPSFI